MDTSKIMQLSPPWYAYHRKVLALFGGDPQIHIKDLAALDEGKYAYMILIDDAKKARAIKTILLKEIYIGNITIQATILGPDEDLIQSASTDAVTLFNDAFSGNPIFDKAITVHFGGQTFNYCIFKKVILQFWNDDMSDYYGNFNGLPSDVAKEILDTEGVQFCIAQD